MSFKSLFLKELRSNAYDQVQVYIAMPNCPEPEIIGNSAANFAAKADYYEKAYDDDLHLKACPAIHICWIEFFNKNVTTERHELIKVVAPEDAGFST